MSAYVCNDIHFKVLAAYLVRKPTDQSWLRSQILDGSADEIGTHVANELMAENIRSVNYRYREDDKPEYKLLVSTRDHIDAGLRNPVDILKACAGLRYQSCEHPEWEDSKAARYLDMIERTAIRALPGYDESDCWEIAA